VPDQELQGTKKEQEHLSKPRAIFLDAYQVLLENRKAKINPAIPKKVAPDSFGNSECTRNGN